MAWKRALFAVDVYVAFVSIISQVFAAGIAWCASGAPHSLGYWNHLNMNRQQAGCLKWFDGSIMRRGGHARKSYQKRSNSCQFFGERNTVDTQRHQPQLSTFVHRL